MEHPVDWNRPATLIRGDRVVQFGDGYRQVSGPTIAEGSVAELIERIRSMPANEAGKAYICNEGGVPQNLSEIERQATARD